MSFQSPCVRPCYNNRNYFFNLSKLERWLSHQWEQHCNGPEAGDKVFELHGTLMSSSQWEFYFYVLVICCCLIGVLCFLWGEVLLLLFWIRVLLYRDQSGLETTMQPRPASNSRQPSFLSLPSAGISHHIWFFVLFFLWQQLKLRSNSKPSPYF